MHFQVCVYTDKGRVRPRNEDSHAFFVPKDELTKHSLGSLFVVSDGVGGNVAGEVASAEAVNVLLQEYYFGDTYSDKLPQRLKEAFNRTAVHVFDVAHHHTAFTNMQCTLTALLLRQNQYYIAHAGDSKAFLLRGGDLIQLTRDHSLVGKLVRMGFVRPEQAQSHPYKHVLLRALGGSPILPVDINNGNIQPGDLFCLVTDGILEHMDVEELRLSLTQFSELQKNLKKIIKVVNERGGYDNMTVLSVKVMEAS